MRLPVLDEKNAEKEAKKTLTAVKEKMGQVFNFHGTLANSPAALQAFISYDAALENSGTLDPKEKETIALIASQINASEYCLGAHTMVSQMVGLADDEIVALRKGKTSDKKLSALIGFVKALVDKRGALTKKDVKSLQDVGYTDGQVVEVFAQSLKLMWTNYFTKAFDIAIDVPKAPKV